MCGKRWRSPTALTSSITEGFSVPARPKLWATIPTCGGCTWAKTSIWNCKADAGRYRPRASYFPSQNSLFGPALEYSKSGWAVRECSFLVLASAAAKQASSLPLCTRHHQRLTDVDQVVGEDAEPDPPLDSLHSAIKTAP